MGFFSVSIWDAVMLTPSMFPGIIDHLCDKYHQTRIYQSVLDNNKVVVLAKLY